MIKCPFCNTQHVDNTLFCSECGSSLLQDNSMLRTNQFHNGEIEWVGTSHPLNKSEELPPLVSKPAVVQLKIGNDERVLEVPLSKAVHIGRVDSISDIFPEIDVTDADPEAKGVSRRHARILKQGNWVTVEDLGSINGTFLNGKRLDPYVPESLSNGDTLQLGKLLIEVWIA